MLNIAAVAVLTAARRSLSAGEPFDKDISGLFFQLLWISLLEIGAVGRKMDEVDKLKLHSIFVGIFLVAAHIAMIFGMLNPSLLQMKM